MSDVAPAAQQLSDDSHSVVLRQRAVPTRSAADNDASGSEHVQRYLAGGGASVTVTVKQRRRRRRHRRDENVKDDDDDDDVMRQLSNYEAVLDEYLHAAIATQDASISSHSGKVQTL